MNQGARMTGLSWIVLLSMVLVCQLAGAIGAFFTASAIPTWYVGLAKPMLNPPAWVFGPVWTTIYALMGIALFLVWRKQSPKGKVLAYGAFAVQLVLNVLWSLIFFGLHNPQWAFFELIVLWLAILVTILAFHHISRAAAWLLVPYLLWVSFAGYLNFSIWQLNPDPAHVLRQPQNRHSDIPLPVGYSLDPYTVAEVLPTACTQDRDCETPGSYLVRSNCPYITICSENRCTVVCPGYDPE